MSKKKVWARLGLLIVAVAMIAAGIWRGDAEVVWMKAANICLECIGIG